MLRLTTTAILLLLADLSLAKVDPIEPFKQAMAAFKPCDHHAATWLQSKNAKSLLNAKLQPWKVEQKTPLKTFPLPAGWLIFRYNEWVLVQPASDSPWKEGTDSLQGILPLFVQTYVDRQPLAQGQMKERITTAVTKVITGEVYVAGRESLALVDHRAKASVYTAVLPAVLRQTPPDQWNTKDKLEALLDPAILQTTSKEALTTSVDVACPPDKQNEATKIAVLGTLKAFYLGEADSYREGQITADGNAVRLLITLTDGTSMVIVEKFSPHADKRERYGLWRYKTPDKTRAKMFYDSAAPLLVNPPPNLPLLPSPKLDAAIERYQEDYNKRSAESRKRMSSARCDGRGNDIQCVVMRADKIVRVPNAKAEKEIYQNCIKQKSKIDCDLVILIDEQLDRTDTDRTDVNRIRRGAP